MAADLGAWAPWTPDEVFSRMSAPSHPVLWWISGGHAIDLFVGRPTRPHRDIDVSILRASATRLRPRFPGWDLRIAHAGSLLPWSGLDPIPAPYNGLWCRRTSGQPWRLQVMLEDGTAERWICRRHPDLAVPMDQAILKNRDEVPYMAPQIQLFMKAKGTRPKEDDDFNVARPLLSRVQDAWLARALQAYYPTHPWLLKMDQA